MEFDFTAMPPPDRYRLLISAVVPRPIALVTTVDAKGRVNAAPFSFFNLMSDEPPVAVLGIQRRRDGAPKDTVRNIRETGILVINLVDEAMATAMNVCAVDFPAGMEELPQAGLTAAKSAAVAVPRIAEAPVAFECRLLQEIRMGEEGGRSIVLAEIVHCHVRDGLMDGEGAIDPARLKLVARLGGSGYVKISDRFLMRRIPYAEWSARSAPAE